MNGSTRQFAHWIFAVRRLADLNAIASPEAWASLERQTGVLVRGTLLRSLRKLEAQAVTASERFGDLPPPQQRRAVLALRKAYLRHETMLDFFADAINSRASPKMSAVLGGADRVAQRAMADLLVPLGRPTVPVVTFVDSGLGAAILKQGLRLWDRQSINPVAMIKVARHNLSRPTAILHEAGHQVGHVTGWNAELKSLLRAQLPEPIAHTWANWSSEIAADAFGFAHAGYASVAALRNVVDGGRGKVFRLIEGDPHPISHLRVLLGIEMARSQYGAGAWDQLESEWFSIYPAESAPRSVRQLILRSIPLLPRIARLCLRESLKAFGDKPLSAYIDPARVSPLALQELERTAGPGLFTNPFVVMREPVRLVALAGYRYATSTYPDERYLDDQVAMLTLAGAPGSDAKTRRMQHVG